VFYASHNPHAGGVWKDDQAESLGCHTI
jgi:hypothetical protein